MEFEGYVIGDDGAVKYIQTDHHWASNQPQAATDAMLAGVDMSLGGGCNKKNTPAGCISFGALPEAIESKLLAPTAIDASLGRVLRARFKLGLMDPSELNPYSTISPKVVDSPAHRFLALRAARQSVVLLTNRNRALPLSPPRRAKQALKIAVIGPNANVSLFGNYNGNNSNYSTVLGGIQAWVQNPSQVVFAKGCAIDSNDTSGFFVARTAAASADVVVAVIGISQEQEHEGGFRNTIELPGVQTKLLQLIRPLTTKLVVVYAGGSAVSIPWEAEHADALLWIGYGGEEAGNGWWRNRVGFKRIGRAVLFVCLFVCLFYPNKHYFVRAL